VAKQDVNTELPESQHRLRRGSPVVVGIDGSTEARRGLLFAADLAETLGVELVVVHAYGLVGSFGDWQSGVENRERQVETALVDEWCSPLVQHNDLTWQWQCVQGSAVEGMLRAADEVDAGFIVVGSHGAGESSVPLLGSTSQHVVRNSHRPVIVVPPADNHPHRRGGVEAMSNVVADT
jgi:nucleotide-binding universal stress UspA family protein